jgi:cytochrome c-type biogenesis protein CcmH/NrfG
LTLTRRGAWYIAAGTVLVCGVGAFAFLRVWQAHGLVHAAESGNVERVRDAIGRAPNDAQLWQLLGEAYSRRSSYAEAVQAYQHSIQLDGTDETTWWVMGVAEVCRNNKQGIAAAESGLRRLNEKSAQEFADLAGFGCCAFGGCPK